MSLQLQPCAVQRQAGMCTLSSALVLPKAQALEHGAVSPPLVETHWGSHTIQNPVESNTRIYHLSARGACVPADSAGAICILNHPAYTVDDKPTHGTPLSACGRPCT